MLKKSASFVLDSSKSSTYRLRFSEIGSAEGVFPFAKIHCTGERPHGVRSVPPPVSIRLRPRRTNILSILTGILPLPHTRGPLNFPPVTIVFPQPAGASLVKQGSRAVITLDTLRCVREYI